MCLPVLFVKIIQSLQADQLRQKFQSYVGKIWRQFQQLSVQGQLEAKEFREYPKILLGGRFALEGNQHLHQSSLRQKDKKGKGPETHKKRMPKRLRNKSENSMACMFQKNTKDTASPCGQFLQTARLSIPLFSVELWTGIQTATLQEAVRKEHCILGRGGPDDS